MTREELEIKAMEFDSKLKKHPMSSEELQKVLCDFVESLHQHDVVEQSEQCAHNSTDIRTLRCNCCNDCGEILEMID